MSDHDVSIDGDGQNGENADGDEAVPQQRKQTAEKFTVEPSAVPEGGSRQWKIEATEHQVWHGQIHNEDRRCIAEL